ncbi:DUF3793 family protein [Anaerocolumna sedimenticola]|uniref:DUF3793 family protein n=1 Tax=Anaerocolumna sedimenticola TaxID=2696063 RepID=A0A6P1TQP9_9FIRM|nr:DUF3793 family protein [Anaerocolumna sedimenticola]QHQ62559.1 DUF3793 family protein [Anaerocolumna sedimenticola]
MCNDIFSMRGDKITSYVVFILANSCMPTLLKIKPATLVNFQKKYIENTNHFFIVLNKESEQFQCSYEILYEDNRAYFIILYQTKLLRDVLNRFCENDILIRSGYLPGGDNFNKNLINLKKRFQNFKNGNSVEFPHEVGIFLGYPILDVEEFIKNNGENYILCGYWKVYHKAEEAGKTFDQFRKLREDAVKLYFSGRDLKEITSTL